MIPIFPSVIEEEGFKSSPFPLVASLPQGYQEAMQERSHHMYLIHEESPEFSESGWHLVLGLKTVFISALAYITEARKQ